MAQFIKKCPDCRFCNSAAAISCKSCGFDIKAVFPEASAREAAAVRFRRCPTCGEKNEERAFICTTCGNEQLHRATVESEGALSTRKPGATVIMKEQPQAIVLKEAARKITIKIPPIGGLIGRSGTIGVAELENCDTVSRHHLKIELKGSNWVVEDLGSVNGTKINGHRINPGTAESLSVDDILTIADLNFAVNPGPSPGG